MKIMKIFFYFMLVPPPPPCSPWEQSLPPLQRSRGERRCFKLLLLAEEVRERRESKQKKKKTELGCGLQARSREDAGLTSCGMLKRIAPVS